MRTLEDRCIGCDTRNVLLETKLEAFEDRFLGWSDKETQWFNQGMVAILSEIGWRIMPEANVLLGAKDGDWERWLQEQCREENVVLLA